jgi:hypothetical protein
MSNRIRYFGELGNSDPEGAMVAEAHKMMREKGVYIEPTDPEASYIDLASPYRFLQSIKRAIRSKQARIASQPGRQVTQVEPPSEPTYSRRYSTPTSLGSGGLPVSAEYLTNRLMELQKHPSKNFDEIMKITKELDRMLGK